VGDLRKQLKSLTFHDSMGKLLDPLLQQDDSIGKPLDPLLQQDDPQPELVDPLLQ